MLKFSKVLLFIIFLCCMNLDVHAELLILKKDKVSGFLTRLTSQESADYGGIICKILLKYQWPMCIASDLTSEEIDSLLVADRDCTEEEFIEKKLRESITDIDVVAAFIPTSIYELFGMIEYFKAYPLFNTNNAYMNAAVLFDKQIKQNKHGFGLDNKIVSLLNLPVEDNLALKRVRKKVLETYLLENDFFYDAANSQLGSARLSFNHDIIDFLASCVDNFLQVSTGSMLEQKISENISKILSEAILLFNKSFKLESLHDRHGHTYPLNKNVIERVIALEYQAHRSNKALLFRGSKLISMPIGSKKTAKIIGSTVYAPKSEKPETSIVHIPRQQKYAPLPRPQRYGPRTLRYNPLLMNNSISHGFNDSLTLQILENNPIANNPTLDDEKKNIVIDNPIINDEKRYDNLLESILKNYKDNLFSISFGSSLFAGYINNQGGCAYSYLTTGLANNSADSVTPLASSKDDSLTGFVLFINKKDQYEHGSFRLFFIPPVSYMSGLFEYGYLFHPRGTVAVQSKKDLPQKIIGMSGIMLNDQAGFFIITRNPFKQAALFSDFIANNSQPIYAKNVEESGNDNVILQAQDQSAKFYKALKIIQQKVS